MSTLRTREREAAARLIDLVGDEAIGEAPKPLRRGDTIERYTVLETIGSGGLGDVYRVYDPKLDRSVALKLIREGTEPGDDAEQRLAREARALAALDHPNVVTVFDYGLERGRLFVVMECIEGTTLRQWLAERSRSWKEIRDAFVEAGQGLAAAHSAGLVHRDFKPDNVLVDRDGRVRVVDFGLARSPSEAQPTAGTALPSAASLSRVQVTPQGALVGTLQFMSPEQLRGLPVDARSDQFSFCVALFHALYGQWPFGGRAIAERLAAIEAFDIAKVGKPHNAPPWLRRALHQGLNPTPARRHAWMGALLSALRRDRTSASRRWWSLAGAALAGAAISAALILAPGELSTQQGQRLADLEADARGAAEDGRFVYPVGELSTALDRIMALEDSGLPTAEARARNLREEFAEQLVNLGDEVAAIDGGAAFAADYYASALLFDPTRQDARERTTLTPGEIAALRVKAEARDFSDAEVAAGELLTEVAAAGEPPRRERIAAALAAPTAPPSRRGRNPTRAEPVAPSPALTPAATPSVGSTPDAVEPNLRDAKADRRHATTPESAAPDAQRDSKADPQAHNAALTAARAALRRADFAEAERQFHRALAANPKSAAALAGLSHVHYERYAYGEAKKFAQRAVRAAPNRARYRVQLGDAYYKLNDYRAAHQAWTKAVQLGGTSVQSRLDRVRDKLGSDGDR